MIHQPSAKLTDLLLKKKVHVGPNSLAGLGVCDRLCTYIRNLQEKNVGNGLFMYQLHFPLLKDIENAVRLKLKDSLQSGQLIINEFSFKFENSTLEQMLPHDKKIEKPKTWDGTSVAILRVYHVDHGRTWEHTVFALVRKQAIYYFDMNDYGYYTIHMRDHFLECLPDHHFIHMISFQVLFPRAAIREESLYIQMQSGESHIDL